MNLLYLIKTKGLGEFYVIAQSATQAQVKVETELAVSDYGFSDDRAVTTIDIVALEIREFPEGKLNFSSKNKLIICKP